MRPVLVTNGEVTRQARREAKARDIELVDGAALWRLLNATPCTAAEVEAMTARRLATMRDVQAATDVALRKGSEQQAGPGGAFWLRQVHVRDAIGPQYLAFSPAARELDGTHWLLEMKGQETSEMQRKDEAAQRWCEDATALTGTRWRYLKVPQKPFDQLQAATLADLVVLGTE